MSTGRNTVETVFMARDGRTIDVEIHATALFDQLSGDLVHTRAFVRDVTERHRLEQQLQQYTTKLELAVSERTQQLVASQARYKALFDLVADSVFMVDQEGTIVAVNKREEQALGYSESEVIGRSIFTVMLPIYGERLRTLLQELASGQRQVPTQEVGVRNAAGVELPVEMDLIRLGANKWVVSTRTRSMTWLMSVNEYSG